MRTSYETGDNLLAEADVADTLSRAWHCTFAKTPRFYEFDYTIVQGGNGPRAGKQVKAFCEIKVRAKHYPTLLLSLHKWQTGLAIGSSSNLPFLIVSATPMGVFWIEAKPMPLEIVLGGRADRGDDQDMEPCVLIPYSSMHQLKGV